MLLLFELIVPKFLSLAYMRVWWKNHSQKCEGVKNLAAMQAKVPNGKGRDSSSISNVRYSTCASWAGVLLPAPTSDIPPSHLLQVISTLCAAPVAARARKKEEKRILLWLSFFSFVGDWDWALSQTSGLWQWSRERSALQATEHKGRERVAATKHGRGWNICLDFIIKITGKFVS